MFRFHFLSIVGKATDVRRCQQPFSIRTKQVGSAPGQRACHDKKIIKMLNEMMIRVSSKSHEPTHFLLVRVEKTGVFPSVCCVLYITVGSDLLEQ